MLDANLRLAVTFILKMLAAYFTEISTESKYFGRHFCLVDSLVACHCFVCYYAIN